MNPAVDEVPALIVGGGPAGLTASLLLSRQGIQTLLVDKRATASSLPRARGVHARAMEILRVCGLEATCEGWSCRSTRARNGGTR
jgi:putative polyketide hydroxylase